MSVQKYPTYKNSGVAWLGEIPAHWEVVRVKDHVAMSGGNTPSRENMSFWGDKYPWVSSKEMKTQYIFDTEEHLTENGLNASSSGLIPIGTLLMVVRSGILKHTIPVALTRVKTTINQDLKAVFLSDNLLSEYFYYWIIGHNGFLLHMWLKQGATVESLDVSYIKETLFALPPLAEQEAIAAFLDRECARIDELVAAQQRMVALLREKRQAVIAHAVTRGLDPAVALRDSGVAWLGQVPAHWEVKRIKDIAQFYGGNTPSREISEYWGDKYPWVTSKDMKLMLISDSEEHITDLGLSVSASKLIPRQSLLMVVRSGILKHTIPVAINVVPCAINQDLKAIILQPRLNGNFFFYWITGQNTILLQQWSQQGATVESLDMRFVKDTLIPLPPLAEQEAIAAFLDRECARIDALISAAERAVVLLQERRSAVIAAAVTGQISVVD